MLAAWLWTLWAARAWPAGAVDSGQQQDPATSFSVQVPALSHKPGQRKAATVRVTTPRLYHSAHNATLNNDQEDKSNAGLSLSAPRVEMFMRQGKTRSLFRNRTELERRIHEMRKLFPGASTTRILWPDLISKSPESLATNMAELKACLSLSDDELVAMLHNTPRVLARSPDVVAEKVADWRAFLAMDHAQLVRLVKRCPELLYCNSAAVRSKLETLMDMYESYKLGSRGLALRLFLSDPRVVVRMSSLAVETRCKRLATDFSNIERSTWTLWAWRKASTCSDGVLDRLLFCRQHEVRITTITALSCPAASWQEKFPEFAQWQQEREKARHKCDGEVLPGTGRY
eukprot:jgi/Chlat1/8594/Chrsp86S08019